MTGAGDLTERVQFFAPASGSDGYGNETTGWADDPSYECSAQFIYSSGGETVLAARLEGRSIFKVKIRQCGSARLVTQSWLLKDKRRGTLFNIREADAVSDRAWVYLLVESGVAI